MKNKMGSSHAVDYRVIEKQWLVARRASAAECIASRRLSIVVLKEVVVCGDQDW